MNRSRIAAFSVLIVVLLAAVGVLLSKNSPVHNQQAAAVGIVSRPENGIHLNPDTFMNISTQPDVTVIDVRTKAEYEAGHIDGAQNLDFYDQNFSERLDALDKSRPYLVYCRSGHRSAEAMEIMIGLGFTEVNDLLGGYMALNR